MRVFFVSFDGADLLVIWKRGEQMETQNWDFRTGIALKWICFHFPLSIWTFFNLILPPGIVRLSGNSSHWFEVLLVFCIMLFNSNCFVAVWKYIVNLKYTIPRFEKPAIKTVYFTSVQSLMSQFPSKIYSRACVKCTI